MSFHISYVLINCFMFFNLFVLSLVSYFVCFTFYLVCFVFLYCFVYCFSPCIYLFIFYLCVILPTTAIAWKTNCSKYHTVSYHIISYHNIYRIVSYIMLYITYHISYRIVSYHNISYRII